MDAHERRCCVDVSVNEDDSLLKELVIGTAGGKVAFKAEDAKISPTSGKAGVGDLNDLDKS